MGDDQDLAESTPVDAPKAPERRNATLGSGSTTTPNPGGVADADWRHCEGEGLFRHSLGVGRGHGSGRLSKCK